MANDPGNGVKGEQLLFESSVFLDAEFDAVAGQQPIDGFTVPDESVHKPFLPERKTALFLCQKNRRCFFPYFTIGSKKVNHCASQDKPWNLEKMCRKTTNCPLFPGNATALCRRCPGWSGRPARNTAPPFPKPGSFPPAPGACGTSAYCIVSKSRGCLTKKSFRQFAQKKSKLSLRTSDRCHWCGNPPNFLDAFR